MGSWGYSLYDNDFAMDIKDDYIDYLKCGLSNEEATKKLIDENGDSLIDSDEAPVFWFTLSDLQWKYGMLLPYVKEKAIEYIKSGLSLEAWEEINNERILKKRKKVLGDLLEKLNSPMPPKKKISPYRYFKTNWKKGDLYAYKLDHESYKGEDFYGDYMLFYTIGEDITPKGLDSDVFPLIYLLHSKDMPKSFEDINKKEFLAFSSVSQVDLRYRIVFMTKSKAILNKFIYIGNYILDLPKDENVNSYYDYFSFDNIQLARYIELNKIFKERAKNFRNSTL